MWRSKKAFCLTGAAGLILVIALAQAQTFQQDEGGNKIAKFDRLPDHLLDRMKTSPRTKVVRSRGPASVGTPGLAWQQPIVTVAFYGGSDETYELIEDAAFDWIPDGSSLSFSFRNDQGQFRKWSPTNTVSAADIRIDFSKLEADGGYWSTIGEMALEEPAYLQTMNFEGFDSELSQYYGAKEDLAWRKSYERSTILHEFGHALGLSHEHFHPDCQADLDLAEAVKVTAEQNNWSTENAQFQIDASYYFQNYGSTWEPEFSPKIDNYSIMLYEDINEFSLSDPSTSACKVAVVGSTFAYELSPSDHEVFQYFYPLIENGTE